MDQLVTYSRHDEIGVIAINNPPVNALSSAVLEGIQLALDALERDAEVRAIVMLGGGRTFVAGADISQLAEGTVPAFHPVLDAIEDCAKPVVMAIHGTALGGGLELAMAGHYRVAVSDAQLAPPTIIFEPCRLSRPEWFPAYVARGNGDAWLGSSRYPDYHRGRVCRSSFVRRGDDRAGVGSGRLSGWDYRAAGLDE